MPLSRRSFMQTGLLSLASLKLAGQNAPLVDGAVQQGGLTDLTVGVQPLTADDFSRRREKAARLMSELGLDSLFIGGGSNLVYFSNVNWWLSERVFGVLLSRRHNPVWVCPAFEAPRAGELVPAGQQVRSWDEHENPYLLIGDILKDWGAAAGRLGLAPDLRAFEVMGLGKNLFGLEIVDGAPVTEGCRVVKDEKEIAFMDLANRITKLAYREGFKSMRPGMTSAELAAIIAEATRKLGSRGGGGPQFGPLSAFPHGSRARRDLQENDIVLVDGGCSVEGYRSDVTRTLVFGKASDRQRRVWDLVRRAQAEVLKKVRPGVTCAELDRTARRVIESGGFGPGYKYFAHRLGHGIGLDGHEYPYLVAGNDLPLKPGMTFSNEPGIYIYGEFGVRIEDCFVVTEAGGRHLGGLESTAIDQPFGPDQY